jgi:hypothetical protein
MSKSNKSNYDFRSRCLLALIGMGDVHVLKHQLNLGEGEQIDIDAYAYALAGVENPEGREILETMQEHEKKKVCDAVANALLRVKQWDSLEAKRDQFNPSDRRNTTYTDRHLSQKGHLIHKLKAKDTTGRWAYYFVLVNQSSEQEFLQALSSNQSIDLDQYGKVVASCYGEKPDEETRKFLKEKYKFDV